MNTPHLHAPLQHALATRPVGPAQHGLRSRTFVHATLVAAALSAWALAGGAAHAQSADDELKPQPIADAGTIERVVLYRGRAAVSRGVHRRFEQGVWAIRVGNLPESVQGASIQAKVARAGAGAGAAAGAAPKMLGVEYSQTPLAAFGGSPEGIAAAEKLRDLRRQAEYLKRDAAQLDQQMKLVEQIGVRATANATNDGGTQALNLDAVTKQLEFVAQQRASIVTQQRELAVKSEDLARVIDAAQKEFDARGGAQTVDRAAIVVVAVPEACAVDIEVTYVVGASTWEPAYSIRAKGDRTGVEIEYDAMITQATGEDWKNVKLSLSTAQPTRASAPPPVVPWFVDVFVPPVVETRRRLGQAVTAAEGATAMSPGAPPPAPMADAASGSGGDMRFKAEIDKMASAAEVQETGTAVSFELPRTLDVPTDTSKKQRTRIATVVPSVEFVYTAQPIVTEDVFLRGNLTNSSAYQLLPGRAQIFMGGDFIGETGMPSVSPKEEFKVYFGPDRALRATRQLTSKTTGNSGFFGGSQTTTWNYRVTLDNGTGRAATIELFDR
ncbi:MAG: DUF4139 domain-containing protein, partial [Phycisphaerae bacterium]|nr:DUF4139 domain-containing protein [Phycisphaerae bacterium]